MPMKDFAEINGINRIRYLSCPELGCKNGFFSRLGGVSTIPHLASLNVGYGLGDEKENVDENRKRIANELGFDISKAVSAKQIHSAVVHTVTKDDFGASLLECDGFVTDIPGTALMIKTADCTPILFSDIQNRVIGAVHAGWRGTVSKIAEECVERMCELGAKRSSIRAAIGPCIHQCCYEVDLPFYNEIRSRLGEDICDEYVKKDASGDRFHADIAGMNREILILSGIPKENIFISGECTCCRPDIYFSHRASKGKRGVMMSAIVL